MPLEFICWSIFHFHIQFRPWLQLRGYVTWDGMNPVGIWGPSQRTPPLAIPMRGELWLHIQVASVSCWGWGAWRWEDLLEGDLAAVRMELVGCLLGADFLDLLWAAFPSLGVHPSHVQSPYPSVSLSLNLSKKLKLHYLSLDGIWELFLAGSFLGHQWNLSPHSHPSPATLAFKASP